MQQVVSLLLVGKICQYWIWIKLITTYHIRFIVKLLKTIVDVTLLLYLLNSNSYDSQVKMFNIFNRVVKIG